METAHHSADGFGWESRLPDNGSSQSLAVRRFRVRLNRRGFASNSVIEDLQKILEIQTKIDNDEQPLSGLIP